jgi:hypothetical protein
MEIGILANHKLDIFETLNAIDKHDLDFYDKLEPEIKKGFAAPVVLRWASAVTDGSASEHYLISVNDRANKNFWELTDHPELQYKLLASCGLGRQSRHQWIPMVGKGKSVDTINEFLSEFWPDANDFELKILINQFTDDTFREFVLFSGCTPERIQEILDAYDRYIGKSITKSKKRKT